MANHTYFQHGDEPDAANFAQAHGAATLSSYIVKGFEFSVDLSIPELTVAPGVATIQRPTFSTASPNIDPAETRENAAHPIESEQKTAALTDNAVNHVFLDVNTGTDSTPEIVVNTTGDKPTEESMKIGQVDTNQTTASEAISDQWYLAAPGGVLTFPDEQAADMAGANLREGAVVYARSENTHYFAG